MGPLTGVKIIEVAGIGPGPFAAMMLADMGADVIRVDRADKAFGGDPAVPPADVAEPGPSVRRARPEVARRASRCCMELVESADALIEGFRPGVAERLGIRSRGVPGPEPEAGVRPDDGLGPGRPVRLDRRARHQLHRARPACSNTSGGPARSRRRRSTSWATSAAAACSWRSAWSARCSSRPARARARSSMPRWSTAPPCS